jgi:hypothetical protein
MDYLKSAAFAFIPFVIMTIVLHQIDKRFAIPGLH